jgi:hypothetical protein
MAFEQELQASKANLSNLLSEAPWREIDPFRALEFFDSEHAPFFHGRTKTVGELLDLLQQQVANKKPFVLVLGPASSGKTSLVRAGILPLLTQAGMTGGNRSWRLALTRPADGGAGDPFDALAMALLKESALPEFPDAASPNGWQNLAAELRDAPENAALRLRETLQYLSVQALDHFLDQQGIDVPPANSDVTVELPRQTRLERVESRVQLALVVDQLEELFVGGFSPELQQRYIAALGALVKWRVVFGIALLRRDFYAAFQKCCHPKDSAVLNQPELSVRNIDLVEVLTGRFDFHPPSPQEIAEMIRLPTESTGLRFELDSETGYSLDAALLEAATAHPEPLPLLEHVLWQLYRKQSSRKDGLLRWSDYRELGEFGGALANHAESVFLALDPEAQAALKPVVQRLVSLGLGEEGGFIRRTVPYRDLLWTPELSAHGKEGAQRLIDQFIQEGLFHTEPGPNADVLVNVTQECLLWKWPRVRQLLNENLGLLRTRDRLEPNFKLWLSEGRKSYDLLRDRSGILGARALLRNFRASLSATQVEYLQKSLRAQNQHRWVRSAAVLAAVAGLLAPVIIGGIHWLSADIERRKAEQPSGPTGKIAHSVDAKRGSFEVEQSQPDNAAEVLRGNAGSAASEHDALQARLRDTEAKARQIQNSLALATNQRDALQAQLKDTEAKAQKNVELVTSQRDTLQSQLQDAEAKAQQVQKKLELTTSQRDALQGQLKDTEARAQQAQKDAMLAASQRDVLQGQLKDTETRAQQAQKDTALAASQRGALQNQLKDSEAKAQEAQKNAELVTGQRAALQNQLKDTEAKAQQAQKDAALATSQRDALQNQLKDTEAKAQQAQRDAALATSQRAALQGQLKDTEAKAQQAQKDAALATSQRDALQGQLKDTEAKAQQTQKDEVALAASQGNALQGQLKDSEAKVQQARNDVKLMTSQRDALQNQLKDTEAKTQQAQKDAALATSQREGLQNQLKDTEAKAQEAQKDAALAAGQRDALQNRLKDTETKAQQAQKDAALAAGQRDALQGQLKDTEAKAQQAQRDAALATSQRDGLQNQLRDTEAKAQQAQKDAALAAGQRDALQNQLKETGAKAHEVQKNAELVTGQRDALQNQLKDSEAEAQQAQKNAELATAQRDALQAQLKDAEAKAQQAQKDSVLASNQRDTLEAEPKTAEEAKQSQQNAEGVVDQSQSQQNPQSAKSDVVSMHGPVPAEGGNEENVLPKQTPGSPSRSVRHQRTHRSREVRSSRTSPESTKAKGPFQLRQLAEQWSRLWQKLRASQADRNASPR